MVRKLDDDEIAEADAKGAATGAAAQAVDVARTALLNARKAGINQSSPRWDALCDALARAIKARELADQDEADWWRSKDFNV